MPFEIKKSAQVIAAETEVMVKPKPTASKAKAPAKAKTGPTPMQQKVDALIQLAKQVEDFKPIKKAFEDLRAELLSLAEPEYGANESIVMTGTTGQVKWGPKAEQRVVNDVKAVHSMLGDKAFYEIAAIKLGDADKYLTAVQKDKVIVKGNTGSRGFSFAPLLEQE